MHAALGEPVRLAIADALVHGDLAPKELATRFELPTNLLAHHLRVMEEAGLIRRRRSEGDGRRSYVQLVRDDPVTRAFVGTTSLPAAARVVFVCTQNSARSQLACAEWQRISAIPSNSAGTRPAARVHRRAIAVGRRHDLGLDAAATAPVADVVARGDLVVAVCDQAHEELLASRHAAGLHWSIPDPVRVGTDAAFEDAFREIAGRVRLLATAVDDPT